MPRRVAPPELLRARSQVLRAARQHSSPDRATARPSSPPPKPPSKPARQQRSSRGSTPSSPPSSPEEEARAAPRQASSPEAQRLQQERRRRIIEEVQRTASGRSRSWSSDAGSPTPRGAAERQPSSPEMQEQQRQRRQRILSEVALRTGQPSVFAAARAVFSPLVGPPPASPAPSEGPSEAPSKLPPPPSPPESVAMMDGGRQLHGTTGPSPIQLRPVSTSSEHQVRRHQREIKDLHDTAVQLHRAGRTAQATATLAHAKALRQHLRAGRVAVSFASRCHSHSRSDSSGGEGGPPSPSGPPSPRTPKMAAGLDSTALSVSSVVSTLSPRTEPRQAKSKCGWLVVLFMLLVFSGLCMWQAARKPEPSPAALPIAAPDCPVNVVSESRFSTELDQQLSGLREQHAAEIAAVQADAKSVRKEHAEAVEAVRAQLVEVTAAHHDVLQDKLQNRAAELGAKHAVEINETKDAIVSRHKVRHDVSAQFLRCFVR